MSKTTEQIRQELDAKIPRSAVSTREAGQGRTLDYLSGYYVKSRLNAVLGQGNWNYDTTDLRLVREGEINTKYGSSYSVHYIAGVVLSGKVGDRGFTFHDYGYGDGTDKANPGKAHELAMKEAITDAVKRCASNLGQSMGLALYDKTQENVEDDETSSVTQTVTKINNAKAGAATTKPATKEPAAAKQTVDPKLEKEAIRSAVTVLVAQKKLSKEDFKTRYNVNGKLDEMGAAEISGIYARIKTDFPELKLQ